MPAPDVAAAGALKAAEERTHFHRWRCINTYDRDHPCSAAGEVATRPWQLEVAARGADLCGRLAEVGRGLWPSIGLICSLHGGGDHSAIGPDDLAVAQASVDRGISAWLKGYGSRPGGRRSGTGRDRPERAGKRFGMV
jgi:hypothetical protein